MAGARQRLACEAVGLTVRTLQRWRADGQGEDQRCLSRLRERSNKLSEEERQHILSCVNQPEWAEISPNQIVPRLADRGVYLASESTFYRVLREAKQLTHRQSARPSGPASKPKACIASAPNQLYSWDITYLPSKVKGLFFYLYLMLDIYSRYIVGWQVHDAECNELAAALLIDVCERQAVEPQQVTLHSDNGGPMKGATMLATMQTLGVLTSLSRPGVSNDNPYSESLFRTCKYRPTYPERPFDNIQLARDWVADFVRWYNYEHRHSAIRFVTPAQRHYGQDRELLLKRDSLYRQMKAKHPQRWSGKTRNWSCIERVSLNPDR